MEHPDYQSPHAFNPEHRTLTAALDLAAELTPERGVTVYGERPTDPTVQASYRELRERVDALAAGLAAIGIGDGQPVLLVLPTGIDFLAAFFACQRLRAVPVPAYPPSGLGMDAGRTRLGQIALRADIGVCLTTPEYEPLLEGLPVGIQLRRVGDLYAGASPHVARAEVRAGDTAFIQYTSGSTGWPKGVVLSHENLTANIHSIGLGFGVGSRDAIVSWCPLFHDMGLIGMMLMAMCWRVPIALMSPTAFIRQPARWLAAISEHRATVSTAPNFGYAMAVTRVSAEQRAGLDLSSWRIAANGAEPVSARTTEAFIATYAPYGLRRSAMFPVYGLAEASLAVAFPELGAEPRYDRIERSALARGRARLAQDDADDLAATTFVSVGRAVRGHAVRIVSDAGAPVAEREVGEILVQGPSIMQGYYRDAASTDETRSDGWLRTGDLGYLADGELYVVGRKKDLIIVRGRNLHPEDIERTVEDVPGVRISTPVVFGVYDERAAEERVVVVAEVADAAGVTRDELQRRVRDAVARVHGVLPHAVVLLPRGSIPKTSSGKRQRSQCRALYLDGMLEGPKGAASTQQPT